MFRIISILVGAICLVLFGLLLLAPASYVGTYGVASDPEVAFMVRRASPMFLGFAVMLWFARDATPSPLRNALAWSIAAAFAGVALTGIFEFSRGGASGMILVAAMGELLIAVLYLRTTKT